MTYSEEDAALTAAQVELERKAVWEQIQRAHTLPAEERAQLQERYQELLRLTVKLRG